jgi:hypothetical protein
MSLADLYAEIYQLTNQICSTCEPPFNCCELAGCMQAASWASYVYDTWLEQVNGGELPYLSDKGCTVAIEHRRLCTTWLCPNGRERAPPRYQELLALIVREEVETLWKEKEK